MSANAETLFEGRNTTRLRTPATVDRAVTPEALRSIRSLRYNVLVRELGCFSAVADHSMAELADASDADALHWTWTERGRVAGAIRQLQGRARLLAAGMPAALLEPFDTFQDEAFATSDFRVLVQASRNGRGQINLLQTCYRAARSAGARFDFVQVPLRQIRAWEQLGYRRHAEVIARPEIGALQPMVLVLADRAHFERLHSPLLPVVRMFPANLADGQWFDDRFPDTPTLAPCAVAARQARRALEQQVRCLDIPLLGALDASARMLLLEAGTRIRLPAGMRLDAPLELARGLVLVLKGGLRSRLSGREFGPGAVCGSLAFSRWLPEPGGPEAVVDSDLLLFDPPGLQRLGHQLPGLMSRLSAAMDCLD